MLAHGLAGDRPRFAEARARLFAARAARVPPATDRKNVCSWIGYAVSGLALAGSVFARPDWIAAGARAADFALAKLSRGGRELLRVYEAGEAKIPAFLDDHAALLQALLDLHRAGAGDRYLEAALVVADELRARFFDPRSRELFFTPGGDPTLVLRPASDSDGATPAASGLAVLALVRLVALTGRPELAEIVDAVLEREGPVASRAPIYLPTLVRAAALREAEPGVALVLGDPARREDAGAGGARARAARDRRTRSSSSRPGRHRSGSRPSSSRAARHAAARPPPTSAAAASARCLQTSPTSCACPVVASLGWRRAAGFFALACALSWSAEALGRGLADPSGAWLRGAAKFGPSAAGLCAAYLAAGPAGVRELIARALRWRVAPGWYALALLGPAALWLAAAAVYLALRRSGPELDLAGLAVFVPLVAKHFFAGGGLGEELGWRGFLQPELERRHGFVAASLAVGVCWGLWHAPVFLFPTEGRSGGAVSLVLFTLLCCAYSLVFARVVRGARGSLLLVALLHAATNASENALKSFVPELRGVAAVTLTYAVFVLALAIWAALRPGRQQPAVTQQ